MNDQAEGTGNTISAEVAARLIKVTPQRLQQLVHHGRRVDDYMLSR